MFIPEGVSVPMALFSLADNLHDAKQLLSLGAPAALKVGEKRKPSEGLCRATVVLVCASWEAFLEDLAIESLLKLKFNRDAGARLGDDARSALFRAERAISELNTVTHVHSVLHRKQSRLLGQCNTPKSANADALFDKALNCGTISASWRWHHGHSSTARARLDAFVSLRGVIAHGTRAADRVTRQDATDFRVLMKRLSICTSNLLGSWIASQSGRRPWDTIPVRAVA